ncbi:hypothetical protein [Gimesia fumaroli]|uniref:Uncharacterized protein n=1 Tax=Gimesia fumaroli TaxID=2527976 RepID=A0A518I7V8_9PLAN|nr:hypothetical protein [Gimesia fumaroli]QDV49186.1 hypothetical protein Enr17x_12030 [Gimesia fumaroli]
MKRYTRTQITKPQHVGRRGVITPLAAMVLLAVMVGIALIVNRLWLDAATLEVTTCVETAVLAAGHELAADELLKEKPDYQMLMQRAETSANRALKLNTVAGQRIGIELTKDDNLLFGKIVPVAETGERRFLQTDHEPLSVQIKTDHTSRINNPVAELMSEVTRTNLGTPGTQIEASLDNHVVGIRPFENVAVPAFPLAILKDDPTGKHTETWELQIVQKKGNDEYQFDPKTGKVTRGSDGIPEIKLTGKPRRGDISDANMQILDFSSEFHSEAVVRQILTGLTKKDLKQFHGELLFEAQLVQLKCSPNIENEEQDAFQDMLGQCRICFLYTKVKATPKSYNGTADCSNIVAGRIMAIQRLENQACEMILQPGVITSRAVVLAKPEPVDNENESASNTESSADDKKQPINKYIYKLYLTQ